jgi:predicted dehydrogenase
VVVCEKSMALRELDYRKLRELLDETHDKVTTYYVRRAT